MEVEPVDPAPLPAEPPVQRESDQAEEEAPESPPEEEVIQDDDLGENVDLLS